MLTSMFYYEHYRPYILGTPGYSGNSSRASGKKSVIAEKKDDLLGVALNKSLNKDVVNYAKNIYRNTTELKYASKKLSSDVKNYSKYKDYEEFDQEIFEKNFENDLTRFAGAYNKSVKFLRGQQHSAYLDESAGKLEDAVYRSGKILSVMGVRKNEDGELSVDGEQNMFWNGKNMPAKTEAANKLFSKVNDRTTEILNYPMSKHMNFKSLNYYYNYEVDDVQVDSFQIIKTGLLVNIAL